MKPPLYADHHFNEPSTSSRPNNASRIIQSMRRPFSPSQRRQQADISRSGMYSTPEERNPTSPSRSRYADSFDPRPSQPPTHQQIAMGLHLSRTPHLRPVGTLQHRHSAPSSPTHTHLHTRNVSMNRDDRDILPVPPLPPPPSRPSLKHPSPSTSTPTTTPPASLSLSAASQSTSTVTSTNSSTRPSQPLKSLRLRIPKFPRPATSPVGNDNGVETPKKAVRFSTSFLGLDDMIAKG